MLLKTETVRMIPMNETHLEKTLLWLSSPDLRHQVDCLKMPDPSAHRTYWKTKWQDPARKNFAVLDESERHVGNCGFNDIDAGRKKAELWIYLGEKQGQKLGGTAARLLLDYAFLELKLHRLYVRVLRNNSRAQTFFRSLGFVEEGCLRSDSLQESGFIDSLIFSLLAHEYLLAKGKP